MKRFYTLLLAILLFIGSIYLSAFQSPGETPSVLVTRLHAHKLDTFSQRVSQLKVASENLNTSEESLATLRETFMECRKRYKAIEFMAEYLDAQYIKDFINGPPLPSLERTDQTEVLEPEGLQILEELIFGEHPLEQKEELLELSSALEINTRELLRFERNLKLEDRFIFEAARNQIIRIVTQGLTGFDTPMASNAILEAQLSLNSVYEALACYFPNLTKRDANLEEQLKQLFEEALAYLKSHPDFDTFDRLHFLTEYANPLYAGIKDMHLELGYPTYYEALPKGTPQSLNYYADNIFSDNLIDPFFYTAVTPQEANKKVVDLGRLLFFDPILSQNTERSCASCHQPERAFTDGQRKSIATDYTGTVSRNAPSLYNVAYADRYFYDLRTQKLDDQIQHVIFSSREFNTTMLDILDRLKQSEEYLQLFKEAFTNPYHQDRPINPYTLTAALSAYLTTLKSFNSPFDQYVRGERADLDPAAQRGFNLFMGKAACGTCHFAPTFAGLVPPLYHENESEVIGVPTTKDTLNPEIDPDPGRAAGLIKEGDGIYLHSFKTTTVRNVELTAPYMHNGVYDTLEEVVDFYNRGGGLGLGLDVPNQTLPFDQLSLSAEEQSDLVAFMKSLTDTSTFEGRPERLPHFPEETGFNQRKVGGVY